MNGFAVNNRDLGPELDILSREAEALTDVLRALEVEHEALMNSDPEALEQATASKNAALDRYMVTKAAREASGLASNIREAIASHPQLNEGQRASGLELATVLRNTGEHCKQLNQRNGMLISALREHTQRALNLVRGSDDGVTLYGQHGNASLEQSGRVLGTA